MPRRAIAGLPPPWRIARQIIRPRTVSPTTGGCFKRKYRTNRFVPGTSAKRRYNPAPSSGHNGKYRTPGRWSFRQAKLRPGTGGMYDSYGFWPADTKKELQIHTSIYAG